MYATKEAFIAREHDSNIEPTIFYIDMRSFGKNFDDYVTRAKENKVRYHPGHGQQGLRGPADRRSRTALCRWSRGQADGNVRYGGPVGRYPGARGNQGTGRPARYRPRPLRLRGHRLLSAAGDLPAGHLRQRRGQRAKGHSRDGLPGVGGGRGCLRQPRRGPGQSDHRRNPAAGATGRSR